MTDAPTRRLLGRRRPKRREGGEDDAPAPAAPRVRDETDSFLDEVNEELRRDRLYRILRRYGPFAIAAIIGLVGWTAWTEASDAAETAAAREAGAVVLDAFEADDGPTALVDAAESVEGGAAMLARLSAAGALLDDGDAAGAAEQYARIAADETLERVYRDLAELKGAMAIFSEADPEALLSQLRPLTEPGRPFRPSAFELSAAAHLRLGDVDAARWSLMQSMVEGEAPQSLIGRASATLDALGGPLGPDRASDVGRAVLLGQRSPAADAAPDEDAADDADESAPSVDDDGDDGDGGTTD